MIWKMKRDAENADVILKCAKAELEGLSGKVRGLEQIKVSLFPLPSASADAMVECVFDDASSFAAYKSHPAHIAVANKYIRPYAETRLSFDENI